jgi:hypothetical protein
LYSLPGTGIVSPDIVFFKVMLQPDGSVGGAVDADPPGRGGGVGPAAGRHRATTDRTPSDAFAVVLVPGQTDVDRTAVM